MKILVTGANGFVGKHLSRELIRAGHEVVLTDCDSNFPSSSARVIPLDVTSYQQCLEVFKDNQPDAVVHLAGLSHTFHNDKQLDALYEVNVSGAANVARSMAKCCKMLNKRPGLMLFISSSFVYGADQKSGVLSCSEQTPTGPRTKYGASKLAAESVARFFENDSFKVYIARPFNHIGPGQDTSFVVPGFVHRIYHAMPGDVIETGDLSAIRDFTDVRDIVRGYRQILEIQPEERFFVFGSGKKVRIQVLLEKLIRISGKVLTPQENPKLLRPSEPAAFVADAGLAKQVLDWAPEISQDSSLNDVWNEQVSKSKVV